MDKRGWFYGKLGGLWLYKEGEGLRGQKGWGLRIKAHVSFFGSKKCSYRFLLVDWMFGWGCRGIGFDVVLGRWEGDLGGGVTY